MPEFETTPQGCRIATSVGGVLTGQGVDIIIIDDPLKLEEALSQPQRSPPTIAVEFHNIAVLGIAMDKGSAQVCSHGNIAFQANPHHPTPCARREWERLP